MEPKTLLEGALFIVNELREDRAEGMSTEAIDSKLWHLKWLLEQTQVALQPKQQDLFDRRR